MGVGLRPAARASPQRRYSLRASLLLLIAVCVLPAAVVSGSLAYANYRLQREQTYQNTVLLARKIASDLDRELSAVESGLRVLATSPDLAAGDLRAFHQRARDAIKSQIVYNYVLMDRNGRQLLNTLLPFGTALPSAGSPAELTRVFHSGEAVLTDLFIGPVTGRPLIAMGVPVHRDGRVVYGLDAGLALGRIGAILGRQHLPKEWLAAVFDSSGTIVARSLDAERFVGEKAVDGLLEGFAAHREGTLETVTKEGTPVVSSFSRSAVSDWRVAVAAPKAALDAELYRLVAWVLAGTTVAVGLGLWLVARLARRVTVSIRGLNDAALALGNGKPVELPSVQLHEADAIGVAIVQASAVMAQVHHLAYHDALTGLRNRVLFDELVAHQLAAVVRSQGSLALLALDLDGFKAVNDRQGHAAGDRVLKIAAKRITRTIRTADVAARRGGDEFAVLLVDADEQDAMQTAQRLVAALAEPYPDVASPVSASVGVAVFPQSGCTAATLLEGADRALYRAKECGKRCAIIDVAANCLLQ